MTAPESLRCPACRQALAPLEVEEIRCHACPGCGGLWFRVAMLVQLLGERFDLGGFLAAFVLLELFLPYRLSRWRARPSG